MKKLTILLTVLAQICFGQVQNNKVNGNDNLTLKTIKKEFDDILLKNEVLNKEIELIKEQNKNQLEYYRDNQNNIFWMNTVFIAIITGAFILFSYLFKRPNEVLKEIRKTEQQAKNMLQNSNELLTQLNLQKDILNNAQELLDQLNFRYENQENSFILSKKSLFFYTKDDWNLVEIFSDNAKIVPIHTRRVNDWIFIGLSYYKKMNFVKSIEAFKKATEIDDNHEIAWKHLGNAYDRNSEFENSIMAYKKVLEINPNNAIAYNNLGIGYITIGEIELAKESFYKSMRLDANNCFTYTNYFELCLVNNWAVEDSLIKDFTDKFKDDKQAMASFEMLLTYRKIINSEIDNLDEYLDNWKSLYGTVGEDESYREIEKWISDKSNKPFEKELIKALNFFSSDSPFRKKINE